eukprot:TRINITY_DN30132_c0_g1_i1.p2 TRINITY_DN30132_c0_g1~~TRINITY_DN30132_c0_g1_i1.p2  ORF type:complete len:104 (-),score=3.95 TRINITY_DN30132_c0_g1_i1:490-777(-)
MASAATTDMLSVHTGGLASLLGYSSLQSSKEQMAHTCMNLQLIFLFVGMANFSPLYAPVTHTTHSSLTLSLSTLNEFCSHPIQPLFLHQQFVKIC